jgi:myo-inositol catabolism protein IolS
MEYRTLGDGNLKVSRVAMGCWGIADDAMWGATEDAEAIATLRAALDAGVNFFDTAEGYGAGESERLVGRAFSGRRDQAVIASKASAGNLGHRELIAACEASLKRLDTDYIDLYQIHWPNFSVAADETYEALDRLRVQGKIRHAGVCNFGVSALTSIPESVPLVSNQLPYSLLWRAIEFAIKPASEQRSMAVLAYSTLLHGLLTGAYSSADEVAAGRARTRHFSSARVQTRHGESGQEELTFSTIKAVRTVAARVGIPLRELALSWALHQSGVSSILVGARTPKQIESNALVADIRLESDVLSELEQATADLKQALGPNADLWEAPSRMEPNG